MSREGVNGGSTRAIAAEAGVAQALVHYIFGSKEELYRAVIEQLTRDLVDQVRDAAGHASGFDNELRQLVLRLWRTVREAPETHLLLAELQVVALRSPQLRVSAEDNQRKVIEVTAALIDDAAHRSGQHLARPATAIARHFLAGFDGLTLQRLTLPDDDAEWAYLAHLVSSLVAYARGELVPEELRECADGPAR
jgi:AcrR family transcriptional regulator